MQNRQSWYERGWWLIKVAVFLLSCWFIFLHINKEVEIIGDSKRIFLQAFRLNFVSLMLWLVLLLAFVNWSIEAIKWRFLILKTEKISFLTSLRAFFNGITLSFFTPNRVGEFAGRVIYLKRENTIRGALLSFIGSAAQLLITIQCGCIAAIIYIERFLEISAPILLMIRLGLLLLFLLSTWSWWKMPRLVYWIDKLKIKSDWKEKAHIWDSCTSVDLFRVWMMSLLRYMVFTTQAVLMFKAVGVAADTRELVGLTALSYFFITLIPSIALGELGVRGSVNIALFGYAGALSGEILLATFGIWMINLALPAFLGAASVLFLKIKKHTTGS
mgnify:CR=1 FL=1